MWSSDVASDFGGVWLHLPLALGFTCDFVLSRDKLAYVFRGHQFGGKDLFIYGLSCLYLLLFFFFLRVRFSKDIFVALTSLFCMAAAQELFFRGALQRVLQFKIGSINGLIIANIVFVIYHITPMQMFSGTPIDMISLLRWFLSGLVFGFMYLRSSNLTAIVVLHFCYNASAFALNMTVVN